MESVYIRENEETDGEARVDFYVKPWPSSIKFRLWLRLCMGEGVSFETGIIEVDLVCVLKR